MDFFEKHSHWPYVIEVVSKLNKAGYIGWLAGGCVRDYLLEKVPKDFDIVTNAPFEDLERIFPKALSVGKNYGILILPFKDQVEVVNIEIAIFRKEGEYVDGRRPSKVMSCQPEEDALRRDFTVNAMFMDLNFKIYDFVNGINDIKKKCLRTVGDPIKRFNEDKLRKLRAVRFVSELGFELEENTYKALKESKDLSMVSSERIVLELEKLLWGSHVFEALSCMDFLNMFPNLRLGIGERVDLTYDLKRFFYQIQNSDFDLRWESLFFLLNYKEDVVTLNLNMQSTLSNLSFSNKVKKNILKFVLSLKQWMEGELTFVEKRQFVEDFSYVKLKYFFEKISPLCEELKNEINMDLRFQSHLPVPHVKAQDLIELGVPGGERMGLLLRECYELQVEEPSLSKEDIINKLKLKG